MADDPLLLSTLYPEKSVLEEEYEAAEERVEVTTYNPYAAMPKVEGTKPAVSSPRFEEDVLIHKREFQKAKESKAILSADLKYKIIEPPTREEVLQSGDPETAVRYALYEIEKAASTLPAASKPFLGTASRFASNDSRSPIQKPQSDRNMRMINFLVGSELGILGFELDQKGLHWSLNRMKQQWSEHPILSGITLAGVVAGGVFPAGAAISKSIKVGTIAKLTYGKTGGLAGTLAKKNLLPARSHVDIVRKMAIESLDESDDVLLKHFQPDVAKRILEMSDDEIAATYPAHIIQNRLLAQNHLMKIRNIYDRVEYDPESASALDKFKYSFYKNFANRYYEFPSDVSEKYVVNINKIYDEQNVSEVIQSIPSSPYVNKLIYAFFLDNDPRRAWGSFVRNLDKLVKNKKISREEYLRTVKFTQALGTRLSNLQADMLAEGFITRGEIQKIGVFHIPVVYKSKDFFSAEVIEKHLSIIPDEVMVRLRKNPNLARAVVGKFKVPEIFGPGVLPRGVDKEKIFRALVTDQLADTPEFLVFNGLLKDYLYFESYKMVRDLAVSALRGEKRVSKIMKTKEEFEALSESAKKFWVKLDDIPNLARTEPLYAPIQDIITKRLTRMINYAMGEEVHDLPYINIRAFEEIFGERGMMKQVNYIPSVLETLSTVHKIMNTVMNPSSHGNNILGNIVFLMMAGVNVFKPSFWKNFEHGSDFFYQVSKFIKENPSPTAFREAFEPHNLVSFLSGGKDILRTKFGTEVNLIEVFSHPQTRLVLDESAFEAAEGFVRFRQQLSRLSQLNPGEFRPVKHGLAKTIGKLSEVPVVKQILDNSSALYLAEDIVPKHAYLLQLLEEGWSLDSALIEIGRRLPQYATIGRSFSETRKFAFPWISFPMEAVRIMKNNITDFPFRMFPWLMLPRIMQFFLAETEMSPALEEIPEVKKSLKRWAVKPTAVLLNERGMKIAGAMATGGLGAAAGGAIGGAKGALVGGVLGSIFGASLAELGTEIQEKSKDIGSDYRSWLLDFLPYSAILPTTTSEFALESPMAARELMELSPIQPLSIIKDLMDVISGTTGFGTDIPAIDQLDPISKAALGLVAFVSPSWMQKYGLRFTEPEGRFIPTENLFGRDIRVPKEVTATAGALIGGAVGLQGGLLGGAAGALIGGLAGSEMNFHRLLVDIGLKEDSITGKPGNPIYDVLFNTFTGGAKNYGASPNVRLVNEAFRAKKFQRARGALLTRYRDQLSADDLEGAEQTLAQIYASFTAQHLNPEKATLEYEEWVVRNIKVIRQHPALRSLSEEELIEGLRRATKTARAIRSGYMRQLIAAWRKELYLRNMDKEVNLYDKLFLIPEEEEADEDKVRKARKKKKEKSEAEIIDPLSLF